MWRHEKLAELVKRLVAFQSNGPKEPGLQSVSERLAFAQTLERRTVLDHQEAWSACLARIAKHPKYSPGTLSTPQIGLIPLGPDPATGWEEFAETATGVPPVRDPSTGKLVVTEAMGVVLVLLPGGTFWMGAQRRHPGSPNYDVDAELDEGPPHEVTLSPFFLSKYELTQGQWQRSPGGPITGVPSEGGDYRRNSGDLRFPVELVSWEDCHRVLRRVDLSIPTEAQWEYAVRGRTTWWMGFWSGKLRDTAKRTGLISDWDRGEEVRLVETEEGVRVPSRRTLVGASLANDFGLDAMLGSVLEWCADRYARYDAITPRAGDGLRFLRRGRDRVLRGCALASAPLDILRFSARDKELAEFRSYDLGIRPSRRITP